MKIYKLRVNYHSGNSEEFWVDWYEWHEDTRSLGFGHYTPKAGCLKKVVLFGMESVESVWQIDSMDAEKPLSKE